MTQEITLLDGGMGQELIRRSPDPVTPLWGTTVLRDHPDLVRQLHLDFIDAGAEIIALNAYTLTQRRMARDGDPALFEPLHAAACRIAKEAAAQSGRAVKIAGSLPPLNGSYHPDSTPEVEEARAEYAEIIKLQSAAADFFIAETMSSIKEAQGAIEGAGDTGKTLWVAFTTFDEDGTKLRSGEPLAEAVAMAASYDHVEALLVNCARPEAVAASLPLLAKGGVPYGAYANGFTKIAAAYTPGSAVDKLETRTDLDPNAYADFAEIWAQAGATIIGGCCEVGPAHIAELARRFGKLA